MSRKNMKELSFDEIHFVRVVGRLEDSVMAIVELIIHCLGDF